MQKINNTISLDRSYDSVIRIMLLCLSSVMAITMLSAFVLTSTHVSADTNTTDSVSITIPSACTMSGVGQNTHTATIAPGTYSAATGSAYENGIGTTTLTTFCNDAEGFAVYAVGYTNDTIGNTNLVGASSTHPTIATNVYQSGDTTSSWSMKVNKVDDSTAYMPAYMYIDNSFNNYHAVPSSYTKVAHFQATSGNPSSTDATLGAKLTTTYAAYAANGQLADTYTGQVKYILVHPNSMVAGTYSITYNANGGSGTMEGETNIPNYEDHTLATSTFTPPTGKVLKGWCTTNTSQTECTDGEFYSPTDTIAPSTVANNTTLNLYAIWGDPLLMQNVSTWGSTLTTGDEVVAVDARDNKQYYVAKLADGNVWMTQNLDHDISSSYSYTSTNTDVSSTVTGLANTYATSNTTWNWSYTAPESYDPGDRCWNGVLDSNWNTNLRGGTISCSSLTSEPNHYHIGNYYNWTAAIAMESSNTYEDDGMIYVNQSICPAGWRLPIYSGSKSYNTLVSTLSLTSGSSGNIQNTPVYFVYGGYWGGDSHDVGSNGRYWSSVAMGSYSAYALNFTVNGHLYSQSDDFHDSGVSIRCVAR